MAVLEISEQEGVPRTETVTSGVPFPKGVLKSERFAYLTDEKGNVLESEKTVLARWPDHSVKWLLWDFPFHIEADATRKIGIRIDEKPVRPLHEATPLRVDSEKERFTVYTGSLRVVINRKKFTVFDEVSLVSDDDPLVQGGDSTLQFETASPGEPQAENWLLPAAGGRRVLARAHVNESKVEFQNSQRLVILVRGTYDAETERLSMPFWTRYTFWKDTSRIGVEHFFAIDLNVQKYFLRTARLGLQLTSIQNVTYGIHDGFYPVPDSVSSLVEMMPDRFYHNVPWDIDRDVCYQVLGEKNKILTFGKEASGVVSVMGKNGNVAVALRDFARLHPKEIRVDADQKRLDYYLWPEYGEKVLDLRRRYQGQKKENYDTGTNAEGGRGVGKTHQFLFDFTKKKPHDMELTALVGSVNEPLRAFADGAYYGKTEAFGMFHPVDHERFPRWEAILRLQLEYLIRLPRLFHWDGMIDWGDTLLHDYEAVPHKQQKEIPHHGFIVRGYDGWLNNDTNIAREVLIFFLRSQDLRLWKYWERMVMHVMDIDTVHGSANPAYRGAGRRHDAQHWGSVLTGYGTAALESSDLYYFTGSLWAREMAILYADWYMRHGGTEWPTKLAAIVRAYEITHDKKYLDFLKSPACLEDPQLVKLDSGQSASLDNPNWRTVGTETGVELLWQLTGDTQYEQQFAKAADLMMGHPERERNMRNWGLRTLAIAYLKSGDRRYLNACIRQMRMPVYETRPSIYTTNERDYFKKYPDLKEDVRDLDFVSLAKRSKEIRSPGPSVRTLIYTYRLLPVVMEALSRAGLDERSVFDPPNDVEKNQ